jgi:hypothetical protein
VNLHLTEKLEKLSPFTYLHPYRRPVFLRKYVQGMWAEWLKYIFVLQKDSLKSAREELMLACRRKPCADYYSLKKG